MLTQLIKEVKKLGNPQKARFVAGFFKTGKGQYGEGDIFLGITVPKQRVVAKKFQDLSLKKTEKLLRSKIHEHRLIALFILTGQYRKGDSKTKQEIAKFYLLNTKYVNNWDLVDSSAHQILGDYLSDKDKKILYKLARSEDIWEKRISIIATYHYIRENKIKDTFSISEILLNDTHDLIHKAVGWMLREVGKRNREAEEKFLQKHYKKMPRTMLRYAIEHFDEKKRKNYLKRD